MIIHNSVNSFGVPLNDDGTPLQIDTPTLYDGQSFYIFNDHLEFQQFLDEHYPSSDSGEI